MSHELVVKDELSLLPDVVVEDTMHNSTVRFSNMDIRRKVSCRKPKLGPQLWHPEAEMAGPRAQSMAMSQSNS